MFKGIGVLEFNTIIGKNHCEEPPEQRLPEDFGQGIKDLHHAVLGAVLHQKNQHETCFSENHCEKNLSSTPTAFDGVHFHDGKLGIGLYE